MTSHSFSIRQVQRCGHHLHLRLLSNGADSCRGRSRARTRDTRVCGRRRSEEQEQAVDRILGVRPWLSLFHVGSNLCLSGEREARLVQATQKNAPLALLSSSLRSWHREQQQGEESRPVSCRPSPRSSQLPKFRSKANGGLSRNKEAITALKLLGPSSQSLYLSLQSTEGSSGTGTPSRLAGGLPSRSTLTCLSRHLPNDPFKFWEELSLLILYN